MGKEITLTIRDLTIWGEGVGSFEGLSVFVEGALPGEEVRACIYEKKTTYAKARLVEILTPSPHRKVPICPVFGKCGGCQIMHLAYEEQLKIKRKKVVDAFERIGKLKSFLVHPCEPSPRPLYYRNKVQMPLSKEGHVGLYAKRSHEIVQITTCYIQTEAGNAILKEVEGTKELRHLFLRTNRKGESLVVLVTRDSPSFLVKKLADALFEREHVKGVMHALNNREDNTLLPDRYTPLVGQDYLEEEMLGIKVLISPASFFQVNVEQAEHLYEKAFALSNLQPGDKALDAYSGIGVFSIYLAKQGVNVTGIEVVGPCVADAKKNAARNNVIADFQLGRVEDLIHRIDTMPVIFLNPPRKGCEESVLQAVVQKKPKQIIYTSCDPATLARDLQLLAKNGYDKIEAYPFDMFPQTMHVETVVRIEKREKS